MTQAIAPTNGEVKKTESKKEKVKAKRWRELRALGKNYAKAYRQFYDFENEKTGQAGGGADKKGAVYAELLTLTREEFLAAVRAWAEK